MEMMEWEALLSHVDDLVLDVLDHCQVQPILVLYWKLFQASADEQATKIYCSILRFTARAFSLCKDHRELQPLFTKGLRLLHYLMMELAGIWSRLNRLCFNEIQMKTFLFLQYLCTDPLDSALSALHNIDPQLAWFRFVPAAGDTSSVIIPMPNGRITLIRYHTNAKWSYHSSAPFVQEMDATDSTPCTNCYIHGRIWPSWSAFSDFVPCLQETRVWTRIIKRGEETSSTCT